MSLAGRPEEESESTPTHSDTEKPVDEKSSTVILLEDEYPEILRKNTAAVAEKRRIGRREKLAFGVIALSVMVAGATTIFAVSSSEPQVPEAAATVSAGSDNVAICESFVQSSLGCKVEWIPNATEKRGALLTQSIAAGSRVDKETPIVLTYSSGPATSEMPNLKNKTVAEAEAALYEMNVSVSEIKEIPGAEIPKGNVISSSVAAGTKVENGSSVVLSVSNGKAGVPNWSEKTKEFVETDAKKLGLEVNFVYEESEKASDLVLSQTPAAGEVSSTDKVEVVLSKSFASKDIKVPDVIGKAAVSAQAELAAAGFRHIKTVTVTNSEVTSTQVTQVVPGVGQIGKSEENLVIIVSSPSK
jgi:serine/threonine-protein kinase